MTAPPIISSVRRPPVRLGRWPWVLAALLICFYGVLIAVLVSVVGLFRVSGTTREVRNNLAVSLGGHFDKQVEVRVGGMGFGLARLALACVDVEPEVKAILKGLHAVEVGVYRVERAAKNRGQVLQNAERGLVAAGWERMVYVLDRKDAVAIYVRPGEDKEALRLCALVLNDEDLVVASLQSDVEAVLAEFMKSGHLRDLLREIER